MRIQSLTIVVVFILPFYRRLITMSGGAKIVVPPAYGHTAKFLKPSLFTHLNSICSYCETLCILFYLYKFYGADIIFLLQGIPKILRTISFIHYDFWNTPFAHSNTRAYNTYLFSSSLYLLKR